MGMTHIEHREAPEKHGVIFALIQNGNISLEKRTEKGTKFFGYTLIPGGAIELDESIDEAIRREVWEEYKVRIKAYRYLGPIPSIESDGTRNYRHVCVVTDWKGRLSNPEKRNKHITVSLQEARLVCKHPISQQILMRVTASVQAR